jgi:hypothetical protein
MVQPYRSWTVRETSTEPIEFQLTRDGAIDGFLVGITSITLMLKNGRTGTWVQYPSTGGTPQLVVTDAANNIVTFTPDGNDDFVATAGFYEAFFWVVDGAGAKVSFPTGSNYQIYVVGDEA